MLRSLVNKPGEQQVVQVSIGLVYGSRRPHGARPSSWEYDSLVVWNSRLGYSEKTTPDSSLVPRAWIDAVPIHQSFLSTASGANHFRSLLAIITTTFADFGISYQPMANAIINFAMMGWIYWHHPLIESIPDLHNQ